MSLLTSVRSRVLKLDAAEASFARRGFRQTAPERQRHLEAIGETFILGFNSAARVGLGDRLVAELAQTAIESRGFAYEGAAMALGLFDLLVPWGPSRVRAFADGSGERYVYMVHVGAGWALARLRRRPGSYLRRLDPLLGHLALDGYGFHEGYFHADSVIRGQLQPARFSGVERRVFDQGVGRSLWFVEGARPEAIAKTIAAFPLARRADLWSGVGLAATYAGAVDARGTAELRRLSGEYWPHVGQGAVFAVTARARAGNLAADHQARALTLSGLDADAAVRLAFETREDLPNNEADNGYERWRTRIRDEVVVLQGLCAVS